jgi:hypothetical protein
LLALPEGERLRFQGRADFRQAEFHWVSGRSLVKTYEAPVLSTPPGYRRTLCSGPVPAVEEDTINIPAGTLDDDPGLRPQRHIFVDRKAAWFDIGDRLPRYPTK